MGTWIDLTNGEKRSRVRIGCECDRDDPNCTHDRIYAEYDRMVDELTEDSTK